MKNLFLALTFAASVAIPLTISAQPAQAAVCGYQHVQATPGTVAGTQRIWQMDISLSPNRRTGRYKIFTNSTGACSALVFTDSATRTAYINAGGKL